MASSSSYEEALSTLFQLIDSDGDGKAVKKTEILKAVTRHSTDIEKIISANDDLSGLQVLLSPSKLSTLLAFSTEEPGEATAAEFALYARQHAVLHVLEEIFSLVDANGDGKLSKTEMRKALMLQAQKIQGLMSHLQATGVPVNEEALLKPKEFMSLFTKVETRESGFMYVDEFQRALSGFPKTVNVDNSGDGDGDAAGSEGIEKGETTTEEEPEKNTLPAKEESVKKTLPARPPEMLAKLPKPAMPTGGPSAPGPPPPNQPKEEKIEDDIIVAPPPPPAPPPQLDEQEDEEAQDAPPPPPPPPSQPTTEIDDDVLSDAGSVDTVESIESMDTVESEVEQEMLRRFVGDEEKEEEKKNNEKKNDAGADGGRGGDGDAVAGKEQETKEANTSESVAEQSVPAKEEELSSSVADDDGDGAAAAAVEEFLETTTTNAVDELQAMLDAQFGDLEKELMSEEGLSQSILETSQQDVDDEQAEKQGAEEGKESEVQKDEVENNEESSLIPVFIKHIAADTALLAPSSPVVRKDIITIESDEEFGVQVPSLGGWRSPSSRRKNKRPRPKSPAPGDRMPIQPGLGAIDIFDPHNIMLPAKGDLEKIRSRAIAQLWVPEGIELLWNAVVMIEAYQPTAKRFHEPEMRIHMDIQMRSFRREQLRRFVEEVKRALMLRSHLPENYVAASQYSVGYWNWEFKNLAETVVTTLQEVDWLSEDAKPRFRSPALAMAEFRLFVDKELRKHRKDKQRRLLSSSTPLKSPVSQLLSPTLPKKHSVAGKNIHHSDVEMKSLDKLAQQAARVVSCTKGMAAMATAIQKMMIYDPKAIRWRERGHEVQKFMCEHMTTFRHVIGRKCRKFLNEIVGKANALPKHWVDANNSFWDFHMLDIAEKAMNALLEVDWLPESAKPLLRALFLTLEQYSTYQDRMLAEAARKERASKVEWKTGVDTSLSRLGIAAISRTPGIGYFPPPELQTSPQQQKTMRRHSITIMPSRKGMAAIDVAVDMMQDYTPQGGRWRIPAVREIKIREMREFLESQAHKFHIELQEILKIRKSLPVNWIDPDSLFWDCHLEEVAGDIVTHLMEVDWLPEAAKPVLRQALLSITLYSEHMQREAKKDKNRRLADVSGALRLTMKRVSDQQFEKTRAQKLEQAMAKRDAALKKERSAAAAAQLAADTDVRLMLHQMNKQQQQLDAAEEQARNAVGAAELNVLREVFAEALRAGKNIFNELHKSHADINWRNANDMMHQEGNSQQHDVTARPSTRGGGERSNRQSQVQLDPLSEQQIRPSTAPQKSRKRRGKTNGGRGGGKQKSTASGGSSSVMQMGVEQLYELCSEAMKGLEKYLEELHEICERNAYERKRKNMIKGEKLKTKSQKRLNQMAKEKRKKRPQVFKGSLAKMIERKARDYGRKQFH